MFKSSRTDLPFAKNERLWQKISFFMRRSDTKRSGSERRIGFYVCKIF